MTAVTSTNINREHLPPSFFQNGQLAVPEEKALAFQQGVEARLATLPPEHHGTFLALVSVPQFSGSANFDPATTEAVLDRLEQATQTLASLSSIDNSGDLTRVVAKALFQSIVNQRNNELETRLIARETVKNQQHSQANKSRQAADETRTGAILSLVITVVASAVSLVMSAIAIGSSAKGLSNAKASASETASAANNKTLAQTPGVGEAAKSQFKLQSTEFKSAAKLHDAKATSFNASGQTFATLGGVANSFGSTGANAAGSFTQANAKDDEAESQVLGANAEETRKENDQAESVQKALDDIIRAIIQFLKESREIENERTAAITRA